MHEVVATRSSSAMSVDDGRRVFGLCCCYEEPSEDVGDYQLVFARGCFSASLASPDFDGRVLFNHDSKQVLGRKSARTARFSETSQGVSFEADLPESTWALDLEVSMNRGDITAADVGFMSSEKHWETRKGARTLVIDKAFLVEASVVSWSNFSQTSAQIAEQQTALAAARLEVMKMQSSRLM
jgi:hypothetical protein